MEKQIRPEWVPSGYRENRSDGLVITADTCKDILFGVAVGDALGVPVEFKSREEIAVKPVTDMIGFGSHHKPPGTFSDDGSLTFCLAEAIASGFSLPALGKNIVDWRYHNYWTADGEVFDVGITTQNAVERLTKGKTPELAGVFNVYSNGNGSLMRILPLILEIYNKPVTERYELIKRVSSVTHGHVRSVIACFYYLEFALEIIKGIDKFEIYQSLQTAIPNHLEFIGVDVDERNLFNRLLTDRVDMIPENQISSSGYVMHTLEASIWCLLTTDNYENAVLKAVNLGQDTDTTGAVTGGLAGLLYGYKTIPRNWLGQLARKDDIEDLALRMYSAINN